MALDTNIKNTLVDYIKLLESDIIFKISTDSSAASSEMYNLLEEIAEMSERISIEKVKLNRTPSFEIHSNTQPGRISFAAIPMGHEFTSFIMAILQTSGRKPKISDDLIQQIKNIKGVFEFETYISLSCHNCPDVVQALNIMSVLNPNIKHTMIDGALYQKEVENRNIMAVPAIYLNGEFFDSGRIAIESIVAKIDTNVADFATTKINSSPVYDVLIIGGGPAGASAAIYASRKGLKTAIVADRFGGQVMDTIGIENFISIKETEGPRLVRNLEEHVRQYDVDIYTGQLAAKIERADTIKITLDSGAVIQGRSVIVSTGARWRELGVPGEKEYRNHGVAYCPHCDGPLFKGKRVAVIGGGNSGVEAAIDLAGIVEQVTLIEYGEQLKADAVLQTRARAIPNITIITNAQTNEVRGTDKVTGIVYTDRTSNQTNTLELEGIFVQIGLVPNTNWLKDLINTTRFGEIEISSRNETNIPGVFAAGDCTTVPYKQIIIAMGEGAKASLSAFDYLIRN